MIGDAMLAIPPLLLGGRPDRSRHLITGTGLPRRAGADLHARRLRLPAGAGGEPPTDEERPRRMPSRTGKSDEGRASISRLGSGWLQTLS